MNGDKNLKKVEAILDDIKLDFVVEDWGEKYKVNVDGIIEDYALQRLKEFLSSEDSIASFFIRTESETKEQHTVFYVMKED